MADLPHRTGLSLWHHGSVNLLAWFRQEQFFAALRTTRWKQGGVRAACLVALVTVTPIAAAGATPTAFDVDPVRCSVEPRTMDELERMLAGSTPAAPVEQLATGDPIDPDSELGRAVVATIETLVACLNAGDRLRVYALYTDAYLASILQPGDLATVATPQPADADERTRIVAIDLHALADHQVRATVTLDPALIPVEKLFAFMLVLVDGEWKINAVINEIDFSLP